MNEPTENEALNPRDPDFVQRAVLQQVLFGRCDSQSEVAWCDLQADAVWTRRQPRRTWRVRALLRRIFTLKCEPMNDVFGGDDEVADSDV